MPVVFVNETISKSMRNEQTDRWSISTVKAIESAATKCEGSADYMIGRILYLNSAAIPIGYSYNNHEIHFPIDKGEFDFSRFSKQKYHGIPLYCINHLLNSGLLNDIDCSDIVCSTKKVQYGKEHPCQNKCPYVFYEE